MGLKGRNLDVRSLLTGAVIGAGVALLGRSLANRDPERSLDQILVNRALDKRLHEARKNAKIRLEPDQRYIIFSDHHKGARNLADNFQQCEATYLAAVDHYYGNGYTLILLGDAEELLEEHLDRVLASYGNVLHSEARFHPDRLVRIFGNHDFAWQSESLVRQHLDPFFPGIVYRETLILKYQDGEQTSGEIFLVHGHQGTLDSDIFAFLATYVLPYYRDFQNLTGLGATSPSQDACLRSANDNRMYRWASKQPKLILIAGHTHRPVWSSLTHLEQLTGQLFALQQLDPMLRPPDYAERVVRLKCEIDDRREKDPPCNDIIKTKPSYFNSGCCRFRDGDITGIEIEQGLIRLIKWGDVGGILKRTELEEVRLSEIFYLL